MTALSEMLINLQLVASPNRTDIPCGAAQQIGQPAAIPCTKGIRPDGVRCAFLWTFVRGPPLMVGWCCNPSFSVLPRMNNLHSFDT